MSSSEKIASLLKRFPVAIEKAVATAREMRASGDHVRATEYERAIDAARLQKDIIIAKKKERDLLCAYTACYGCGLRIDGDGNNGIKERRALYNEFTKVIADFVNEANFPKNPSERLRFMIASGHQMQQMVKQVGAPADLTYETFETHLSKQYATAIDNTKLGGREGFGFTFVRRMWSAYKWVNAGSNQFQVTNDLAAALVLTDVPEATSSEMKLPYETLAFSIPQGTIPFAVPDEDVKYTEWADTLWIERVDEDKYLWIIRWRELEIHQLFDAANDEWFRTEDERELATDDETSFSAAHKLVRNFALWLNAEGPPELKRAKVDVPKKLAEKRARSGEQWPRQWLFGKEVKISPELRRAAVEAVLGRSRHAVEGWSVRARFTVRGHWRNQAHGVGRSQRTRKWIAPFWKGPAEKEAWAHIYKPKV